MRSCLVLCVCSAMAACGGGSEEDFDETTAALPVPVQAQAQAQAQASSSDVTPDAAMNLARRNTTPAPAPAPVSDSMAAPGSTATDASCGLNGAAGIQAELMQRINALRAAGAVCGSTTFAATQPLIWNSMLMASSTGHSTDMANKNYFSHTSLDGRTVDKRITAAGYRVTAAGENIAAGQTTVQAVITGWTNSAGHCRNMMNPTCRDVGVACVRNDASAYRRYWTMNLGRK